MFAKRFREVIAPASGLGLGLVLLALPAGAQAAWHGTASHAALLQKATDLGVLPDGAPMHITVALRVRNPQQLDAVLQAQQLPVGRTLSAAEVQADYAPTDAQVQAVTGYLQRAGFSNIQVAANKLLVTAQARRSLVEAAFNTSVHQFKLDDRTVFANTRDAQVPDELNGIVLAITGLQNATVAHPLYQRADAAKAAKATPLAASATGHVPVQFPAIYDAAGIATGGQTAIGIISDGDLTQTVTDLHTYESQNGLAQITPLFVPSEVNGTDTSGTVEWDLDSQTSTSMAGGVGSLYFFNAASLSDADLEVAYNNVLSYPNVKAINVSLGACESGEQSSGAIAASDQIFKLAAAAGQTFFVSSGDGGAYTGCSSQQGISTDVSYPASSPYVVAVGGTTLDTNSDGSYAGETAWAGSGGGVSTVETAPSWQQAVTGSTARSVPDIAMDADPNSGALIIDAGSSEQVGGTSLAAPLSTGSWARIQSAHGNGLGFAAPVIYAAAASTPAAFHDVTSGCNNGTNLLDTLLSTLLGQKDYCAKAGFDSVTGFGSLDVAKLNGAQ